MKYYFLILLMAVACLPATAQNRNNVFGDIALSRPGGSVTFDRKLAKHLEAGFGVSVYDHLIGLANIKSAAYVDLRPYWAIKRSLIFAYVDIGAAFHSGRKDPTFEVSPIGFYCGLGVGYGYMINKRGMGPYITFGIPGYGTHQRSTNMSLPPAAREYSVFDANSVISVGFKF